MTTTVNEDQIEQQVNELVERFFMGAVAALELLTVHLGSRLGLWDALAQRGRVHHRGARDRRFLVSFGSIFPQLITAYRTGGGYGWLEAVHDMSRPVEVLAQIRAACRFYRLGN
jgi:hypothetical protein